jgi:hypothetical protein
MLLRRVDERIGLTRAVVAAAVFGDRRDPARITRRLRDLLAQRLDGTVLRPRRPERSRHAACGPADAVTRQRPANWCSTSTPPTCRCTGARNWPSSMPTTTLTATPAAACVLRPAPAGVRAAAQPQRRHDPLGRSRPPGRASRQPPHSTTDRSSPADVSQRAPARRRHSRRATRRRRSRCRRLRAWTRHAPRAPMAPGQVRMPRHRRRGRRGSRIQTPYAFCLR